MLYDTSATDPCFVHGRPPDNIEGVIQWARDYLQLDGGRPWRLISARRRFGKTLFEVEEQTNAGNRRLIGKLGKTERAETLSRTLKLLRENGFRPPSMFIVPEPIVCVPEKGFVLQEKAVGTQASALLSKDAFASVDAARWLARLHGSGIEAPFTEFARESFLKSVDELKAALPNRAAQIDAILDAIQQELLKSVGSLVPSHGDFHPMNIFIAESHITGIDLDKFGRREPEFDVAAFLAQSAAFDFFESGSFDLTVGARRAFIEAYGESAGRVPSRRRTAMYMAAAFLKNLHFEVVLLETGRTDHVDPWLRAAAAAVFDENLDLEGFEHEHHFPLLSEEGWLRE